MIKLNALGIQVQDRFYVCVKLKCDSAIKHYVSMSLISEIPFVEPTRFKRFFYD